MAANQRVAPPAIIARAGADLLADLAAQGHQLADLPAAERAIGRAIEQLIAAAPYHRDETIITFSSRTRPGAVEHHADHEGCSCEAGQDGAPCWHRAARAIILRLEQLASDAPAQDAHLPSVSRCVHCGDRMRATETPAGEPCFECVACGHVVMAAIYILPPFAQDQAA